MDLGIAGKRALVVGATGETGGAVAAELEAAGCDVLRVARKGVEFCIDITEPEQILELVEWLPAPDIVVHVAGGSAGIKDPLASAADWAKVWQLNLGASIELNRAFLPGMLERGWGRIVHFSSNGVKLAIGNAPYTSAKSALEGYVRNMGKQYAARGVAINAVSPGPIYTEGRYLYSQSKHWEREWMTHYLPIGRWGRGAELAGLVAFLCSTRASYLAGAILDVDGGMR